jgi:hypothetical protein
LLSTGIVSSFGQSICPILEQKEAPQKKERHSLQKHLATGNKHLYQRVWNGHYGMSIDHAGGIDPGEDERGGAGFGEEYRGGGGVEAKFPYTTFHFVAGVIE